MERPPPRSGPIPIRPGFQRYAWGDPRTIPALFGLENSRADPYAEAWFGAHPSLPSTCVLEGGERDLASLVSASAGAILGPDVARRFGGFPFLLKILTAARPLSIQVHPSRRQAEEGFAREEDAGIPIDAPHRSYRDRNHKPELIVALTDFHALSGFRPLGDVARSLEAIPELAPLAATFRPTPEGLRATVERILSMDPGEADAILGPLVARLEREGAFSPAGPLPGASPAGAPPAGASPAGAPPAGAPPRTAPSSTGEPWTAFPKDDLRHWILRADRELSSPRGHDRGILLLPLLNLVRLRPGQGLSIPAGVLHAHLEGTGVEIMASSDNVLRCGLTSKPIDAREVLRVTDFRGERPQVIEGRPEPGTSERIWAAEAAEFELRRLEIAGGASERRGPSEGPEILLVVGGAAGSEVTVRAFPDPGGSDVTLTQGGACLIPHGTGYELCASGGSATGISASGTPASGAATIFRAVVPAPLPASGAGVEEAPTFRGRRPARLSFGTSGLRGLVTDITDLEAAIDARGFLEFLLAADEVRTGSPVAVAGDLRPSTDGVDRSILRAVAWAIEECGLRVVNCGKIPTPALLHLAIQKGWPSVMVTGSHIPFDRNGIKFNKPRGEVLKADEAGILAAVAKVRRAEYARPPEASPFADDGMFRSGAAPALPPEDPAAREGYIRRYLDFFPPGCLARRRIVLYEHSAVGRDILREILEGLGAEVIPIGRSGTFVPIDTEAVSEEMLGEIQALVDAAMADAAMADAGMADGAMADGAVASAVRADARRGAAREGGRLPLDAVVSTDGDSDRPLLLGVDRDGRLRFFGGDVLGIVVAEYLGADSIALPVSATDSVDLFFRGRSVVPVRTRIGSPHVIAAMAASTGSRVVGWEANGGFLTGTPLVKEGRRLSALPTRDAALPLVAALHAAAARGESLIELFARLPRRFGRSGLLDGFPPETSRALLRRLSPRDPAVREVIFRKGRAEGHAEGRADAVVEAVSERGVEPVAERRAEGGAEGRAEGGAIPRAASAEVAVSVVHRDGTVRDASAREARDLRAIRDEIARHFGPARGFDDVLRIDFLDGVRASFANGDIAHVRPSGNAPQLRIYAVSGTEERAEEIVREAFREPDGILRGMEAAVRKAALAEKVLKNVALARRLLEEADVPAVMGTVSGSAAARDFWQRILDRARASFGARVALSLHEDLPTNQAFGVLLLWQRLAETAATGDGALVAFVFGEGTRSTPFTEAENGQKPAIATFVRVAEGNPAGDSLSSAQAVPAEQHTPAAREDRVRHLSMVELALRHFVPVERFLRRSGFRGLVIKWGDEVQIPARDLAGSDPLFAAADVVRFVSLRRIDEDDARNKDWVGVDGEGRVTAFIPRRPLREMEKLADRGLLARRADGIHGGVNLGSIAISYALLDALLEEFRADVNDRSADRSLRPDLDPQFFTAMTVALLDDPRERARAWEAALEESEPIRRLARNMPDALGRLRRAYDAFRRRHGRKPRVVALDFGDQYWGDIGQHSKIHDFYMSLNDRGPEGEIARALAGIDGTRDADGNIFAGACSIGRGFAEKGATGGGAAGGGAAGRGVVVRDSVCLDVRIGAGEVRGCVLVGTRAGTIEAREAFDVLSTVTDLSLEPRAGTYKVVSLKPVRAGPGERATTLFLPEGPAHFRVLEATDLRDRAATYDRPILGNPLSFRDAHEAMAREEPEALAARREAAEEEVLGRLREMPGSEG